MSETKRRGRPLGSKNKPKIELKKTNGGSYVLNVKMEKQVEDAPVNRDSHRGWIPSARTTDTQTNSLIYTIIAQPTTVLVISLPQRY